MWGDRYFARPVKDDPEYEYVMNYIDQNPVKAGLARGGRIAAWCAGTFQPRNGGGGTPSRRVTGTFFLPWDYQRHSIF